MHMTNIDLNECKKLPSISLNVFYQTQNMCDDHEDHEDTWVMNETTMDCLPTASLDHSATNDLPITYQKPTIRLSLKKETTIKLPNLEELRDSFLITSSERQ